MDFPKPFDKAITLENFMKTTPILHCNAAEDDAEAISFCDYINEHENYKAAYACSASYDAVNCFRMMNVGVMNVDANNNSYYDYIIQKDCDILTDIRVQTERRVKLSYFIGSVKYDFDKITELILCKIIYDDIKLRITFLERPITQDEFKVFSRRYFIDKTPRKSLLNSAIKTNYLGYMNGKVYMLGK